MASGSTNSCKVKPKSEEIQAPSLTVEDQPDYDFVDQPDEDYYCPISFELLTQPHQTFCCGHHISQQAVERLIGKKKPCPMCKEDNFTAHVDKFFTRKVRQLKVYCSYKKSECEWTGELGDLDQHTTSCPKRPWKCPYCDLQSTYDIGTNDHAPQCDYQSIPCPNHCEVDTVPRCHVDNHLLTCPLQLVDCEFASAGCDVRVPRKDLAGHMTESVQHHLMTATLLNLRLTRDLQQKMEEKVAELTRNIDAKNQENMKLAMKLFTHSCHPCTLKIFTKYQGSHGRSWCSEPFYNHPTGYKFKLNIDVNGYGSARGTHLTAYLYLLEGVYDPQLFWPVTLEVTLDMLNQEEENNYYSVTREIKYNKFRFNSVSDDSEEEYKPGKGDVDPDSDEEQHDGVHFFNGHYRSIGKIKFFPLAQLEEKNYLKNNQLKFRLWLKVIS